MYLEHFNLKDHPFSLTPNTQFFCELPGHIEALNVVLTSLHRGDGFIKITGKVGAGKTMLCRMLLDALEDPFVTAYLPNPDLKPLGLCKALARELGIDFKLSVTPYELHELINKKLIEYYSKGKHVVMIIDEAQALSNKCLETLRLFTNLQTESSHLLQIVMSGQPQLDHRLDDPDLWQLKQRIVFSYRLQPLSRTDLDSYLCHRLAMAGFTHGSLFNRSSVDLLYKASQGIPRVINILCDKALMVAFGRADREVNRDYMQSAIGDTESIRRSGRSWTTFGLAAIGIILMGILIVLATKLGMH
ncbi:MAG: AAA family ATPase [Coxiellaceae bacterium]|nr:AAA family ATPase [Coxiellaceae bacterium]